MPRLQALSAIAVFVLVACLKQDLEMRHGLKTAITPRYRNVAAAILSRCTSEEITALGEKSRPEWMSKEFLVDAEHDFTRADPEFVDGERPAVRKPTPGEQRLKVKKKYCTVHRDRLYTNTSLRQAKRSAPTQTERSCGNPVVVKSLLYWLRMVR